MRVKFFFLCVKECDFRTIVFGFAALSQKCADKDHHCELYSMLQIGDLYKFYNIRAFISLSIFYGKQKLESSILFPSLWNDS